MLKKLINRPIAVTMILVAIVVVTLVSLRFIPVSLMPDIDIPQITVQVAWPGASVRQVDQSLVRPLRNQLMQVNLLKDIQCEARTDAGTIHMSFEPGSDIDLIFIEVNEKMDRAMSSLPEEVERPKVLKASATDIPAFYINLSLKEENDLEGQPLPQAGVRVAQLGDFARDVVAKRIEQLPQTAMVDVSGLVERELLCLPDWEKMNSMGLTADDLQSAISRNNLTMGVLSIADGIYRYNIHFDSQVTSKEDIENIVFNHDGRLYRFSDVCRIVEQPARRKGMVREDRHNAVTLAVIKQNDAQMKDLQKAISGLIDQMESDYPDLRFQLTRDQTQLLSYSLSNLKGNLILGALLACLILFLFMSNFRLPSLIAITIPLSLIFTLLGFHLLGITLNIISLSGLILGVGMMVDNSIIVIDNIAQKWQHENSLPDAIQLAVREVFSPMLSSVLTTCSVFIPLIFLSGTAGALFYDQAMAVTLALFSSLLVSVLVIPVYFYLLFKNKSSLEASRLRGKPFRPLSMEKPYEAAHRWVFGHSRLTGILALGCLAACLVLFRFVPKSSMPRIDYDDALLTVDWNAGISVEENDRRCDEMLSSVRSHLEHSTSMIGVQDFLLSHTQETTASEAILYLKSASPSELDEARKGIVLWLKEHYPSAVASFGVSGNIFDLIFSNGKPDLTLCLQKAEGGCPSVDEVRYFISCLSEKFPKVTFPPVSVEDNIHYEADVEMLSYYGITYGALYNRLSELVNSRAMYHIGKGSYRLPVTLGQERMQSEDLLRQTIRSSQGLDVPLSYLLKASQGEDFKNLYSGRGGDYYPLNLQASDREVREIVAYAEQLSRQDGRYSVSAQGAYYSSRALVKELLIVLLVAVALLFFILAAQFESLIQPFIILSEIVIDLFFVLLGLWMLGESINIMSLIGMVVMSGIIINDSILKVDTINRLRREGMELRPAIDEAGRRRLNPIVMTSLTTILAIAPFLYRHGIGSALQYPLSLTLIIGMAVGTLVSLLIVPLFYYLIYRKPLHTISDVGQKRISR